MNKIHRTVWSRMNLAWQVLCLLLLGMLAMGTARADWAANFGALGPGTVKPFAFKMDSAGNQFFAGHFDSAHLPLGSTALNSLGLQDGMVVKRAADGSITWAKNIGGPGATVYATGIALDAAGDVYVTGSVANGNLTAPAVYTRVSTSFYQDGFVVKFSGADGSFQWIKGYGGNGTTSVQGIALMADNGSSLYVTGLVQGSGAITVPSLPNIGTQDGFLLKLSATDGSTTWAQNFGGTSTSTTPQALALDGSGNLYLTGYYNRALTNPTLALAVSGSSQSGFVFKVNPADGSYAWVKGFGGGVTTYMSPGGIAVDGAGKVYLAGWMQGSMTTPALTAIGTKDAFVFQIDASNGDCFTQNNTLWKQNYGGASAKMVATSLLRDGNGKLVLGGYFQDASLTTPSKNTLGTIDIFAMRVSSTDGAVDWIGSAGGAGATAAPYLSHIDIDGSNNVYYGAFFSGASLTAPTVTLSTAGATDAVLLKFSATDGSATSLASYSGSAGKTLIVREAALDTSGNVYLVGDFTGSSVTLGGTTLTRMGTQDVFVAMLNSSGVVQWATNYGGSGSTTTAEGLSLDGSGNVYLSGYFTATLTNLTPNLTKTGLWPAFLIKANASNGTTLASTSFNGTNALINRAKVRAKGTHVYVGGRWQVTNLTNPPLTLDGSGNSFLAKVDATTLATVWSRAFGNTSGTQTWLDDLDVDASGNVVIAGNFYGATLTALGLTKTTGTGTIGDAYIAKFNNSDTSTPGTLAWAFNYGGGTGVEVTARGVRIDGSNVYVSANLTGGNTTNMSPNLTKMGPSDAVVFKLNYSTGATVWAQNYGGSGATVVAGRSGISAGNSKVFLSGNYAGADMGSPTLTRIGTQDAFVLTLNDSDGTVADKVSYGGSAATVTDYGIATDSSGGYLIAGSTNANLSVPALTRAGATDGWAFRKIGGPTSPDAPTGVSGTAGNGQASVSFTPGADNGTAIINYTVTCTSSDGGTTGTNIGTGSPIVVIGLTNGKTYTCTVTANNGSTSPASSPSASFVPLAVANGACGSASSSTLLTAAPSGGALCSAGSLLNTVATNAGTYTWTCQGTNGGNNSNQCSAPRGFTVTSSAGANGSISPSGAQVVAYNATPGFTLTPASSGYGVLAVGGTCGGTRTGTSFTTTAVQADCSVTASFAATASAPSIPTQASGVTGTLSVVGCTAVDTNVTRFVPVPAGAPANTAFPFGLLDFKLNGCSSSATVTVTYSAPLPSGTATFYKQQGSGAYTPFTASIDRNTNSVTFTLIDGGLGDDDGAVNGSIHDPSGLGFAASAESIPTLSEWGLIALAGLMGLLGLRQMRRRSFSYLA
jgi:hypothetical protein